MGQHLRHYKALMRKNWILWKRTWVSSLCELICPILLMAILTLARLAVSIDHTPQSSQISQSTIFYPAVTTPNNTANYSAVINSTNDLYKNFYNFSDILMLQKTPFLQFGPEICEARSGARGNERLRDIIAIGPNNSISWSIVQQIQSFNSQRKGAFQYFNTVPELRAAAKYLYPTVETIDFRYKTFESHEAIMDYLRDPNYDKDDDHPGICFGWSLTENSNSDYDLKMIFNDHYQEENAQAIPSTLNPSVSDLSRAAKLDEYKMYARNGFSQLQNWIANAILQKVSGNVNATIAFVGVPMKVDAFDLDSFSQVISGMLPFFMLLMYILPVYRTLSRILSEKETKARESMKMMGLKDSSYWLSWFTYYFLVTLVISIICTIIISANVIKFSTKGIVFLYFFLYGLSLFGFIVFFQAFFSTARIGAIAGTLVYFGTSFVNQVVKDQSIGATAKTAASLLSTVAVSRGATTMGAYEIAGVGVNYNNINDSIENYSFAICLVMMVVSLFVFLIIGLYLENVLPSTFGLRKPFYYFLQGSYWCGEKRQSAKINHQSLDTERMDQMEEKYIKHENFEPPSQDLRKQEGEKKTLQINELKKTFSNGFQAVKGINVRMYTGQIFALLGHNGAGKTTTISMLTGLLSSTAGSAEVFGYDLFQEMNEVRSFLGVCPQHDILFDMLTPIEHLEIFCDFKGVDKKTKNAEITKILLDVDLAQYKNTLAKNLSGGSRRKLSVAIALIGGSKFVLLDEPTAGMDLSARRKLWNMLKDYKQNRIIILTTHYMDEADILGDRIGIMTGGQLVCLGSSLFLKNRFGVGYNLTMVKKFKEPNLKIGSYLHEKLGEIKKLSEVSSEITFQIPTYLSHKFKDFFEEFDRSLDSLEIRSYGISVTTLEEVFLKVGHPDEVDQKAKGQISDNLKNTAETKLVAQELEVDDYSIADQHETGVLNVFLIHLVALFRKKFFIYRKNAKGLFVEIFVPVLLVIIGFAFSKVQFFFESPSRVLEPSVFPLQQRILVNDKPFASAGVYDISTRVLIGNLPEYDSFYPSYKDYTQVNVADGILNRVAYQFDNDVFDERNNGKQMPYRYGSYFIYEANNNTKQFKVSNFVNTTSQDALAFYPQFMYESILKTSTGNPNFKFKVTNTPFPITARLKARAASASGMFVVFVVGIAFALIPAAIVSTVLNEREKNLKQMQMISGMNIASYWISNYIFDILKAEIPMVIVIGFTYAFSLDYENVWTVFLMYPIGVVPFTYATSFIFQNESIAQTVTIFIHFVFAGIGGIIVFILRIIVSTQAIGDGLNYAFKIIPSFSMTNSIMYASGKDALIMLRGLPDNDFAPVNMGGDLIALGIHFVLWTIVLIILEGCLIKSFRQCFKGSGSIKPKTDLGLDEDVIEEEQRVEKYMQGQQLNRRSSQNYQNSNNSSNQEQMQVVVNKFRKVYNTGLTKYSLAVEKTSFGLDFGECFALLGVNGAGKTTTFKSLTNEIIPTSGDILIGGLNARTQFGKIRKMIGYCPQHDCIFELMTVVEHLDYYSRIKGIVKASRHNLVERVIKEMNLESHRNKTAGSLSGGNKRKLSVAIAVLGNPPIILLDEPSAGMDPEARRFMWSVVAKISQQRKKSAVILTTHSMEEAEALSTKMGIMVKGGVFKCFGSSQHIKNKYGTGYEIEVKVRKLTPESFLTMKQAFGLNEENITLVQCVESMRKTGVDELLVEELKQDGFGSDIFKEAKEMKGLVNVRNFLNWLHVEIHGLRIIYGLIENFGQVEMLEHYNDYYKMRIPRQDKSIGYVFGLIETRKEIFGISEYSVSQTTLEQIFQAFANMEIDVNNGFNYMKQQNGRVVKVSQQDHAIQRRQSAKKQIKDQE